MAFTGHSVIKVVKFKYKGPIFSPSKHEKHHYLGLQAFYSPLTTAICQSLTPINSDKLFFPNRYFPASVHSLPLWSHSSDRWLAADGNLILSVCWSMAPPPPDRLLRQGKGPLNYDEVNSRRWQRDTVAGAPNGPLWRNSEFMRHRVSYLVDSSQGVLPCEPFDSLYICGTFSDLPPCPQPSMRIYWQNYAKRMAGICGFCF